jgi:hypothetical protein
VVKGKALKDGFCRGHFITLMISLALTAVIDSLPVRLGPPTVARDHPRSAREVDARPRCGLA